MFLKWEYMEVANRRFSLTSGCDWNTKTVNLDYFNFELGSHTNTEIHFYTLSSKLQKVNWETPKKIKRNLLVCKDLSNPSAPRLSLSPPIIPHHVTTCRWPWIFLQYTFSYDTRINEKAVNITFLLDLLPHFFSKVSMWPLQNLHDSNIVTYIKMEDLNKPKN